jgi:Ala-tRNA(Pro) deacylase
MTILEGLENNMVPTILTDHLTRHRVPYTLYPYDWTSSPRVFAQQMAVSGFRPVQVTPFRVDGAIWLVAYDASSSLLPSDLAHALSATNLEPIRSTAPIFNGFEMGALPPFGQIWGADVLMDASLAHDRGFIFRGGTYEDAIEIQSTDYFRIEHPLIAAIATEPIGMTDPIAEVMETSANWAQGREWTGPIREEEPAHTGR